MDMISKLPGEIIHTIMSFLSTKEAAQTSILSKKFQEAWSTIPDLKFDFDFTDHRYFNIVLERSTKYQEVEKDREKFVTYVDDTVTRYQEKNIPMKKFYLRTDIVDVKIANILDQCIRKVKEIGVKEVHLVLFIESIPTRSSTLLQTIFALKRLVVLKLTGCDLEKDIHEDEIINYPSLRKLLLMNIKIDEGVLQKLIHGSPCIENIALLRCKGPQKIQVANLPNLKSIIVDTVNNQMVDVKVAGLETMSYEGVNQNSPYLLNIESTQNLKNLSLGYTNITDVYLHKLIAKCPLLEELSLKYCKSIEKIKVSSHSLGNLCISSCQKLEEAEIDAPNLNFFHYLGDTAPSFSFGNSGKRESSVCLFGKQRLETSWFRKLREFLMKFTASDNIRLAIKSMEISFDNTIDDLGETKPEFEEFYLSVHSPSSTYSTLMDGLLWSFSPRILLVEFGAKRDEEFIKYLCEELLVKHDPSSSSSSEAKCWQNYYKQMKIKRFEDDTNDEWWPVQSCADVLRNLEDYFILSLSHDEQA